MRTAVKRDDRSARIEAPFLTIGFVGGRQDASRASPLFRYILHTDFHT